MTFPSFWAFFSANTYSFETTYTSISRKNVIEFIIIYDVFWDFQAEVHEFQMEI